MPLPNAFDVEDLPVDVFALADSGLELTSLTADEVVVRKDAGRSCVGWPFD